MDISTLSVIGTIVILYLHQARARRADTKSLRAEMGYGFTALDKKIEELRTDMNTADQALNTKIDTVHQSLNTKIDDLRTDMNTADQALNTKIDTVHQSLNTKIDVVYQSLGDELRREMKQGFDRVDRRLNRIEDRLSDLTRSLGQVEGRTEILAGATHSPANPH